MFGRATIMLGIGPHSSLRMFPYFVFLEAPPTLVKNRHYQNLLHEADFLKVCPKNKRGT